VLVLEGGFTRFDHFVYLPIGADEGMLKVWQASILDLFLRKEKQITPSEKPETVQAPDAWFTLRKQSWARLLGKVYAAEPQ